MKPPAASSAVWQGSPYAHGRHEVLQLLAKVRKSLKSLRF